MNEEIPMPTSPLGATERAAAAKLTAADLQIIDSAILANSSNRWLKVARVVTDAENALKDRFPDLTYRFYALRLADLVDDGKLESKGNLDYMRFSEVRIPNAETETSR